VNVTTVPAVGNIEDAETVVVVALALTLTVTAAEVLAANISVVHPQKSGAATWE
jgi:hypothetical protein